jgi:hypothetical protein
MANTNDLAAASQVASILRTNSIMCEVDGSIKRITLDNLMNSINEGDEQLLRQVAWGVPILDTSQSSPEWGVIGNTSMRDEWNRMKGRYLVTPEGKAAKLSSTNSGIYADGTTLDETKGHVMRWAPRLYYLFRTNVQTGVRYLWMSLIPIGGHYIEEHCVGAYKAADVSGVLVSRSGLTPKVSMAINQFWNEAQKNGADWGLVDYDFRRYHMMEGLSDYGCPNIQAHLGQGVGGSAGNDLYSTGGLTTGATKSYGDSSISVPFTVSGKGDDTSRVSLHGIEDSYNWLWEFTQGVYFGTSGNSAQDGTEVFIYEGNRLPTSAELTSSPNGAFRQISRVTSSNYMKEIYGGEYFDLFAKSLGGGSNSYWCDYSYNNTTGQVLRWGGNSGSGSYSGLAYASSNDAWSVSYAFIGSRLAYYGKLNFVNGKDIA